MTQMLKSNFEVVSDESLFDAVAEASGLESDTVKDYITDRVNQDIEANGQGWEYGLIYLSSINKAVQDDVKNYEEGEDDDAVLIADTLTKLLETNDPETLISFQGW